MHLTSEEIKKLQNEKGSLRRLLDEGESLEDIVRANIYMKMEYEQANVKLEVLAVAGFTAFNALTEGYTLEQLKEAGYSAKDVREACRHPDLGIPASPTEMMKLGYRLDELIEAEYTKAEYETAGFTLSRLKGDQLTAAQAITAGYTPDDLKAADYAEAEILEAKVHVLFGGKTEVTKDEWKTLSFAHFQPSEYQVAPSENNAIGCDERFDAIWAKAHLDEANVPTGAKLTMKDVEEFAKDNLNLMTHDASSFQAGEGFLKTLEMCVACFQTDADSRSNSWQVCKEISDAVFVGMEKAKILPPAKDHRSIVLWSGVDDFGKGFAVANEAIALARLPMDRVLTILTGLEAKRRAKPGEEWEVQNWEEHTLRPWEAVSKSLVRWGEQAEKLTIYVVLKRFSTGSVFWQTEMKTLCADYREVTTARENVGDAAGHVVRAFPPVTMDVRLHARFDKMQRCQRGKSDKKADAQFPLAADISTLFGERLKHGSSDIDGTDKGCFGSQDMYTLTVRAGLGDDYAKNAKTSNGIDDNVDNVFGDNCEFTKEEWTKLTFARFNLGNHDIAPDGFDAIWKKVHPNDGDVPNDAKLTVFEVDDLANK